MRGTVGEHLHLVILKSLTSDTHYPFEKEGLYIYVFTHDGRTIYLSNFENVFLSPREILQSLHLSLALTFWYSLSLRIFLNSK